MQSYVSGVSPITSSALRDLRVQRFQPGSFVGLRACCYPESWPINHLAHPSPEVAKLWGAECCWKSHGGTGNAGALSGERWKKAHWFLRKLCWCQDCVCWNGFLWMQLRITRMMHIMSNVNSWTVVSSVWFSNACFESMATLLTLLLRFFFFGGGSESWNSDHENWRGHRSKKSWPSTWEMPCHTIPQGPEGAEIDLKSYEKRHLDLNYEWYEKTLTHEIKSLLLNQRIIHSLLTLHPEL